MTHATPRIAARTPRLLAATLLLLGAATAQADCSNTSLEGVYAYRGTLTTAQGVCQIQGQGLYDGQGQGWEDMQLSCPSGGTRQHTTSPLRYQVESDCTGMFESPHGVEVNFELNPRRSLRLSLDQNGVQIAATGSFQSGLSNQQFNRVAQGMKQWQSFAQQQQQQQKQQQDRSASTSGVPKDEERWRRLPEAKRQALSQRWTAAYYQASLWAESCCAHGSGSVEACVNLNAALNILQEACAWGEGKRCMTEAAMRARQTYCQMGR